MNNKIIESARSIFALVFNESSKDERERLFLGELNKCNKELSPIEYMQLIQLLGRFFTEMKIKTESYIVPDCRTCEYSSPAWGSGHHLSCSCPHMTTVIGDEHGIKNGWFVHPFNFYPIWLQYCDSYKKKG
ncbi:MAG: hypothetical protein RR538_03875 [Erysipelotrichaceae bacterium]|uniref:hypothetical protein n=1 Tax=Anaerorhabdus sp. TaxID=1872524 RepID=UPI002FC9EB08